MRPLALQMSLALAVLRGGSGLLLAAFMLSGCGAEPSPAQRIAERCEQDGEPTSVCRCLGERAAALLDPDVLRLVLLAADGGLDAADRGAAALSRADADEMAAQLSRIDAECRAPAPPAQGAAPSGASSPPV
jgi:hypothetical protein